MTARALRCPGAFELRAPFARDARGSFAKPFHASAFARLGLPVRFREAFWSASRAGAVRGLHFQTPPHAAGKLVWCVQGEAFDALLDLRAGSPRFGRCESLRLSARRANAVFVPPGVAHGFQALRGGATLCYLATAEYAPRHDHGVRWDSAGIRWPLPVGAVSARDRALPALAGFRSPFKLRGGA
ncbi:MAG: dTDP-4-dehydrorhamnose 3,5-epimerase family protein [Elusimicrobia bacterium]|nr:dTDP-4-dehydrorhamnose 3,5-epimerase family protein [Elusimicrobiota bacterium]